MTYREQLQEQIAILEAAAAKVKREIKTSTQRALDCPAKSKTAIYVLVPELNARVEIILDVMPTE